MLVVRSEKQIDLSDSLIRVDANSYGGIVNVLGSVALDQNFKVLPLISAFLSECFTSLNCSSSTVETYGRNILYFFNYVKSRVEFGSLNADEMFLLVKKHAIKEYFVELQKQGIHSRTIRNRDSALHMFFCEFLCKANSGKPALRSDNPYVDGLLSKPPKTSLVESCPIYDLRELMLASNHERERALLQFIYDSGLRRSEVGRVTVKDIDDALEYDRKQMLLAEPHLTFSPSYAPLYVHGSKGRGGEIKPRYTLVSVATLKRVKRLHASPAFKRVQRLTKPSKMPAFLNYVDTRYTPSSVSKLLDRLSTRAVKYKTVKRKYPPHTLRHGFAYLVLQSLDHGVDLNDRYVMLQKYMGHNQLKTTDVYTRIPHDLFENSPGQNVKSYTRAEKMEILVSQTKIK